MRSTAARIDPKQHFTEPPPRYTEASLVKALEENGIGRPVDLLHDRRYDSGSRLRRRKKSAAFTDRDRHRSQRPAGRALQRHRRSRLHGRDGGRSRQSRRGRRPIGSACCATFYGPFALELEDAEKKLPKSRDQRDEPTDEICPNCERPMVIKTGRFGKFISCTGYPECKTTKPILKDTGAICPKDGGMIVERKSRKGRTFYGCANYPEVRLRLVGSRRSRSRARSAALRRRENQARRRRALRVRAPTRSTTCRRWQAPRETERSRELAKRRAGGAMRLESAAADLDARC